MEEIDAKKMKAGEEKELESMPSEPQIEDYQFELSFFAFCVFGYVFLLFLGVTEW